ncbi:MAG: hypothetical protein ACRD19_03910 [Terriglobia bacterium]
MPFRIASSVLGFTSSNIDNQLGELIKIARALRHESSIRRTPRPTQWRFISN